MKKYIVSFLVVLYVGGCIIDKCNGSIPVRGPMSRPEHAMSPARIDNMHSMR